MINVITTHGRDIQGTEVSVAGGSFDSYQGRVSYAKKFSNGLEMLLSGTYYDSKGRELYYPEFDDPTTNNGVTSDTDDETVPNLFAKLSHGGVTLTATYA